jgi:hypothetical protein
VALLSPPEKTIVKPAGASSTDAAPEDVTCTSQSHGSHHLMSFFEALEYAAVHEQ